jgi:hypothetical protein
MERFSTWSPGRQCISPKLYRNVPGNRKSHRDPNINTSDVGHRVCPATWEPWWKASYVSRDGRNRSSADTGPLFGIAHAHHSGLLADRVICCDLRLDMAISGVYLAWKERDFSGSYGAQRNRRIELVGLALHYILSVLVASWRFWTGPLLHTPKIMSLAYFCMACNISRVHKRQKSAGTRKGDELYATSWHGKTKYLPTPSHCCYSDQNHEPKAPVASGAPALARIAYSV